MSLSPEQKSFDFDGSKPDIVEVPMEAREDRECTECGNLLASDSPGCAACKSNDIKLEWQVNHKKETAH